MIQSLGKVTTTTGNPVRATANESDPTAKFYCNALRFQALGANTKVVYLGDSSSMNTTTLAGVLGVVGVNTGGTGADDRKTIPLLEFKNDIGQNVFDASLVWIEPAVSNEGVLVTAILT